MLPLNKSDDPFCFNNYRPVSLLCVLSKVFEKVMYNRLLDFLEDQKFFVNEQFGFRKLHSSKMAFMISIDKLIESLDRGEYVIGMFLDFSKAFDTVDHKILLQKMYHYEIRGPAYDWLPEASFGLRVLSLPASVCLCVRVFVCPCVCVSITGLSAR